MVDFPRYLNTREAAQYTGISEATLERRRLLRQPPVYCKIDWLVRYRRDDLDQFMADHKVKAVEG